MTRKSARLKGRRTKPRIGEDITKEEVFAKLNASAERTLRALQQAYEAGAKAGFEGSEEDTVIELLRRAKKLRDQVREMTSDPQQKEA